MTTLGKVQVIRKQLQHATATLFVCFSLQYHGGSVHVPIAVSSPLGDACSITLISPQHKVAMLSSTPSPPCILNLSASLLCHLVI